MPDAVAPAIAAVLAAIGAGIGYFLRGQIRGSTADKLWDVTERLRQEQAAELRELKAENREHEKRIGGCERELAVAQKLAEQLQREGAWKDALIERLTLENATLRAKGA